MGNRNKMEWHTSKSKILGEKGGAKMGISELLIMETKANQENVVFS
jgi:hypothetical protein